MRSTSTILALAALAGLTFANSGCKQKANDSDPPSGNPISLPGADSEVPVGEPYDITWAKTLEGTVSIVLLRGPSTNAEEFECIVDSTPNTGKYTWTPSTSLENDKTHYGLKIIVDGTGQYQYSTQFGIKNDQSPKSSGRKTKTKTEIQKVTQHFYHTTYHSTTPISSSAPESKTKTKSKTHKSKFSHFPTASTSNATITASTGFLGSVTSSPSIGTGISSIYSNKTKTHHHHRTSKGSETSIPVSETTTFDTSPGVVPPSTTTSSSTSASTGLAAATRVAVAGMLAGAGAVAAFVL